MPSHPYSCLLESYLIGSIPYIEKTIGQNYVPFGLQSALENCNALGDNLKIFQFLLKNLKTKKERVLIPMWHQSKRPVSGCSLYTSQAGALHFILASSTVSCFMLSQPTSLLYINCLTHAGQICNPYNRTSKIVSTTVFTLVILIHCLSPQLDCKFHETDTVHTSFIRVSSLFTTLPGTQISDEWMT